MSNLCNGFVVNANKRWEMEHDQLHLMRVATQKQLDPWTASIWSVIIARRPTERRLDPRSPPPQSKRWVWWSRVSRWKMDPLRWVLQNILKIVALMEEVTGCTLVGLRGGMINKEQHPRPIGSREMGRNVMGQNLNMTGTVWLHEKA